MKYKLLLLDIDGTLRPGSCERVPKENAEAVCAVQKAGVKIAIATGRGRIGVGKGLLRSIRPDYWVCAGGAQLVDYKGADLALHRLTTEEMYALVDFFEDYDLPLRFTYHDANYAYLGYEEFARREREKNLALNIVDGEDQDKHLEEMPFGAFGFLSQEMADRFQEKYGYLGLNFLFSYPVSDGCDILQQGIDKGAGLRELAKLAGIDPAEYSSHKLRHTAATLMLQNGVDVRAVQEVLGHDHLNTTEIYTHIDNESLRIAAKANPLSHVKKSRKKQKETG